MIGTSDALGPGGRHSRHLMDAPTEQLHNLAEALARLSDDDPEATDTHSDTDTRPDLTDNQVNEPVRKPPLLWEPPPRGVMEQVLAGLKRMTWSTTAEGDEPDGPDRKSDS